MSKDATLGVVDPNLRVHGIANLHVCSGAVFASGGHANPTLTIMALALRMANALITLAGS
jgi:choline dehydrogenase-like flavoprotein